MRVVWYGHPYQRVLLVRKLVKNDQGNAWECI